MPLHMFCYAFVAFDSSEGQENALIAGTVNDWSVKALIDKNKNSYQTSKRYYRFIYHLFF